MKKQTAVSWLNSELERLSNQIGVNLSWAIVDDLIKQAKEKEKGNIAEAFDNGAYEKTEEGGEDYYNENYK